ncbi:MAG: ATP-binding cassette domain-containing protein [Oscillospiraceae bacterium]|jgi:ABC-type lipoprotein export system ATPase subunit
MADQKEIVLCENLVKIYKTDETEVVALQGLDLSVEYGEITAIIGNSGSGKSTLLNMLGGLDKPSAGTILVDGLNLGKFTDHDLIRYKRNTVGFVWQNNARNLIPYLSATENIELPMRLNGKVDRGRALELLDAVGLSHRRNNKLHEMSGGEQQRVAIAIALANNPKLLLADEPTGAVDSRTSDQILNVFREVNRATGVTIIIVTHDMALSRKVDRVVAIRDGRTSSEILRKTSYADELGHIGSLREEETHVELAVLDRSGRLQIPREYLEQIGAGNGNKLLVELEDGKIVIQAPHQQAADSEE